MSNDDLPPPSDPSGGVGGPPPAEDPTQMMPVVPPPGAGDPTYSASDPYGPAGGVEDYGVAPAPVPWYKQPATIGVAAFVLLAILGAGLLLASRDGDDDGDDGVIDDPVADAASVALTRLDVFGNPIDTLVVANVGAPGPTGTDYEWVVPPNVVAGTPGQLRTDSTGRVEFFWRPPSGAIVERWTSRVELREAVPTAVSEGGQTGECVLVRDGVEQPLVVDISYDVLEEVERVAVYSFVNVDLLANDEVSCSISNLTDIVTTTSTVVVETTTTTVPEETTTTAETTTVPPETTTTTLPPETTTTTLPPETTTTAETTTTVPPTTTAPIGFMEFLESRPDLSELVSLLETSELDSVLDGATDPFTMFAPNNTAIDAARNDPEGPNLDDPDELRDVLLAHVSAAAALSLQQIVGLDTVPVESGGSQPVDATVSPPTVGGAGLIETDLQGGPALIHVTNAMITPLP